MNQTYDSRLSIVPKFTKRTDVVKLLPKGAIGVELGVAEGKFSESLLQTGHFAHFYSIDMWKGDRGHDVEQYKQALRRFAPFRHCSTALRMTFDEALNLFPNHFFDFIYVDGYAHTGEEEGQTFRAWWPKLKPGGIMAGDDYSEKWPLVIKSVDQFVMDYGLKIAILDYKKTDDPWSQYPSWITVKPLNEENLVQEAVRNEREAEATYRAAEFIKACKDNNDSYAISMLEKIDFASLSQASLSRNYIRDYFYYFIKSAEKNKITPASQNSIVNLVSHALKNSLPSSSEIFPELNKLCTKQLGDWIVQLAEDDSPEVRLVQAVMQEACTECIDNQTLGQHLREIKVSNWHWWALVSLRLLRLGYAQPAYFSKQQAAHWLVHAGNGSSQQIAAARVFLSGEWQTQHPPQNTQDQAYAQLLQDKRVALLYSGTPPEDAQVVVSINCLPAHTTRQYAQVLYCSESFYTANETALIEAKETGKIQALVLLAPQHSHQRCAWEGAPVFLGYGYAARRAIADLLYFDIASLECSGIDFFLNLSEQTSGPNMDHGWSYFLHDPLDMWRYLKALHEKKLLKTDATLTTILAFEETEFIERIGMRVAPWLHASTAAKPYKIISFYTEHNEYKEHAERLKQSLDKWNLSYELHPIELNAPWESVCAYKAQFIRDEWKKSSTPIVWLDADATVERNPEIFAHLDTDFAIHKWNGWQFGSGTIFFGKSEETGRLLDQWVIRCQADPLTWDQIHLQSAWCDIAAQGEIKTTWLPRSYLQIFDQDKTESSVILHWQASRSNKNIIHSEHTPQGIRLRNSERPWRNSDEAFWITQGTSHIVPNTGDQFPEGDYVSEILHQCVDGQWPLLEIGCGVGRIASLFDKEKYIGADINPNALLNARINYQNHNFRLIDKGIGLPHAPTALMYTVLLHVSDEEIKSLLSEYTKNYKKFIIAEVMDDRWRRSGFPPVFNRNPETYISIMQDLGFQFTSSHKRPYKRYDTSPWNIGRDSRLTFLVFERKIKKAGKMWIRGEDRFMGDIFSRTGDQFEIDNLRAAMNFCPKKRIALDIGAHYGSWSRHISKEFNQVFSFEPVAATYECCKLNIENFDNIHLYQKAVGDHIGKVSVDKGKFYAHPGMETIIDFEGETPLITVDSLGLDEVDFIKIDVEGFELAVLQGAKETIKASKPIIIFEENLRGPLEHNIPNGSCTDYLMQLGYRLLAVENKDFIFGPIS